ncbi:hypothetical protein [Candidatus Williamhamiltonella defendens]|uniref:Uncharacterized protein n=1 Tax=Candidatus Williamhamiltonella defendens TaxID=138072 RepID=A0A2D3TBD8_9ENTR|nr:hypothetical protein [Candidatus Hamiltonella defensa]ATW33122.1 hypothetical protein BJP43_01210 [Candidatus Hamiltonella defensa]
MKVYFDKNEYSVKGVHISINHNFYSKYGKIMPNRVTQSHSGVPAIAGLTESTDQPAIQSIPLSNVKNVTKTIETSSRSQINSKKSSDELSVASFSGAGNTEKKTSTVSTRPSITHEKGDEFTTKIRKKIEGSYRFKSEALLESNWAIDKDVKAICALAVRILFSTVDNAFKYDTNQASGVISLKKHNDFTEIQFLIFVNKNSSGDLVSINTFDQFLIEHAAKNSDSGIIVVDNKFFNKTKFFDKQTPEKYKEMGFQLVDNDNKHYGYSKVCMLLDLNKSPLWEKDSNGKWCFKETNQ